MSLAKYLIEMQYHNSMQCGDDLEKVAVSVRSVAMSDLNDILEDIRKAWKGDPASTCLGKISSVQVDIMAESNRIARTAGVIKTIADNVRKAEIEAYRIATGRDYS